MEIGTDSFVSVLSDPATSATMPAVERIAHLLDEIALADDAGLDVFGIGEHHRAEFLDAAPTILLAAAAARTRRIRLASAVTVLGAADPVRVFQEFATVDLVSRGRAEIVVGRGSFVEAYPLFGLSLKDYDTLFSEKLDLLLKIRAETHVHWKGRHRPPLTGQAVYPRPLQEPIPIWIGVGGTPESFIRAGTLGLPLMIAIIGGQPAGFRPLADLYREAGRRAGHPPERLKVGVHALGSVAESNSQAAGDYYPGYARMFNAIGRERGWPPVTRAHFDALLEPEGALVLGDPDRVAAKILHYDEVLGGISRFTMQLSPGCLPHEKQLRALGLLGREAAPRARALLEGRSGNGSPV